MIIINKQIKNQLLLQMTKNTLLSAIEIYTLLAKQGLKYASLAKYIAQGNNLVGFCTNKYLQLVAKWQTGLIINNNPNADILLDHIKITMAYEYAQYIINEYNKSLETQHLTIQEIPLIKIRELHMKVFMKFGLNNDVWILAIPFKVYDCLCYFKSRLTQLYTKIIKQHCTK